MIPTALKALAFPPQDIQQVVAARKLRWILNSPEQQWIKVLSTDTKNDLAGEGTCQYRSHEIRSIQLPLVLESPFMDEQRDEELKVSFKTSLHMLQISTNGHLLDCTAVSDSKLQQFCVNH